MRTIDADALIDNMVDYVVDGYAESPIDFESYTKMVQTAPTIDAVSVVRCKDCKYWEMRNSPRGWCVVHQGYVSPQYFCADGERKEK